MTTTEPKDGWAGQLPPPEPGTAVPRSRYDRFKGEVVSGGSVTEPEDPDAGKVGGSREGRIAGLVILALLAWLAVANAWAFVFVIGLLVSVFLHETGHFVTARLTGMKATQFFLGFGPRLWSFQRGETEYGVRALPAGAFVRIIGMHRIDEVPPADEGRTYRQQSFPRRLLVISAGSLMHLLIAIVLLFTVFSTKGELTEIDGSQIGTLVDGGPAADAGLQPDDIVTAIDGQPIVDGTELGESVRTHDAGDVVTVTFTRDGEQQATDVTLGARRDVPADDPLRDSAYLGVTSGRALEWQEMSIGEAAASSVTDLPSIGWQSIEGVVKVLNPVNVFGHVTGRTEDLSTRPTTVVGVAQVSGSIGATDGLAGVLFTLALLNIFVGIFNMLPLLPLDGGHAAVAIYERIREGRSRRRYFADIERLMPLAMGVVTVLLVLFMSGLYLDLTKPLG